MATSYLDKTGLEHLWDKIKTADATKVDKDQGSANADKYLGTDSDGVVTLRDGLRVTDDGNGNVTIVDGVNLVAVVETYDLPVATPTTLGGVQPVAKTADMTQAVGVDANGLLYTNASAQSDWNENDSTDPAYVLNRPAIRMGDGENSVMIGQIEQDESAAIYTIYITGDAKATTYSYTTTDTLPSTTSSTGYLGYCIDYPQYIKVSEITADTITFVKTFNTTAALSNIEVKLYYRYKIANGKYAMAEGFCTVASGSGSHAEGNTSYAMSAGAHAEGSLTAASGNASHAEGSRTIASGLSSHAENNHAIASGMYCHAEGFYTIASSTDQHVQGKYNIEDTSNTYADIVGNGTSDSARSNAYTLDWSGNGWYAGKLTVGTGPTENMDVATKQYVDAATAGVSPNLSGLADTNISSPATGQILTYDGTTSKWVNTTSPYMTASQVNELIAAALAEYGDGDTASYGFEDASEVSY